MVGRRTTSRRVGSSPLQIPWLAGVTAAAMLIVLSPVSSAFVVRAPYIGTGSTSYQYLDQSGCSTASISSPVNWTNATGSLTTGLKAGAKNCGRSLGGLGADSFGLVTIQFEVVVPLHVAKSGTYSVAVTWNIHATISKSFRAGVCTPPTGNVSYWFCDVSSGWLEQGQAYLENATAGNYSYGTIWNASATSFNETSFHGGHEYNDSGSLAYGRSGTEVSYVNSTALSRADTYYVLTYVYFEVSANVVSSGATLAGGSGSAELALSSGANRALLSSIVVT